jgi:hypothetical protein
MKNLSGFFVFGRRYKDEKRNKKFWEHEKCPVCRPSILGSLIGILQITSLLACQCDHTKSEFLSTPKRCNYSLA